MKKLLAYLALFFAALPFMASANTLPPDELVKSVASEVMNIIKSDKDIQKGDQKKIYALVDAKVLPHFDFTRMTRLAVGRYWREATPEQQQRLTKEFRDLLVRTYAMSLANYKNQTIEYKPLRVGPNDTDVTVKTVVIEPGRQPIPIDYQMVKTADGWKVYDITVEGVSLVVNYRSSFAQEIQQGGIERLIHALAEKNAQVGQPATRKN
ncbi:MlaC/ttg2D family ABC transporter substrate-binding protein [Thiobacter aerophilum]|uniref:ABC transporter substrate-binding protein n=1 Tax=Thiobacter aerophilum TaxID=3121275 RepID=A0ABV0EFP3_9BURK